MTLCVTLANASCPSRSSIASSDTRSANACRARADVRAKPLMISSSSATDVLVLSRVRRSMPSSRSNIPEILSSLLSRDPAGGFRRSCRSKLTNAFVVVLTAPQLAERGMRAEMSSSAPACQETKTVWPISRVGFGSATIALRPELRSSSKFSVNAATLPDGATRWRAPGRSVVVVNDWSSRKGLLSIRIHRPSERSLGAALLLARATRSPLGHCRLKGRHQSWRLFVGIDHLQEVRTVLAPHGPPRAPPSHRQC